MFAVKFLGTGGARFAMLSQLRKTGGIYITTDDTRIHIDPGPGALINMLSSRPKLDPRKTDIAILTHKHLDHSNDINLIIEAMTDGGFKKRGYLLAPQDSLENDPPVLNYLKEYLTGIFNLYEGFTLEQGNTIISSPLKMKHGVETYGIEVRFNNITLRLISDTGYFSQLKEFAKTDFLIANVLSPQSLEGIDHLSFEEFLEIISEAKPAVAVMTHFGTRMLRARPWILAEKATKETGVKVIAAGDGSTINIENIIEETKNESKY